MSEYTINCGRVWMAGYGMTNTYYMSLRLKQSIISDILKSSALGSMDVSASERSISQQLETLRDEISSMGGALIQITDRYKQAESQSKKKAQFLRFKNIVGSILPIGVSGGGASTGTDHSWLDDLNWDFALTYPLNTAVFGVAGPVVSAIGILWPVLKNVDPEIYRHKFTDEHAYIPWGSALGGGFSHSGGIGYVKSESEIEASSETELHKRSRKTITDQYNNPLGLKGTYDPVTGKVTYKHPDSEDGDGKIDTDIYLAKFSRGDSIAAVDEKLSYTSGDGMVSASIEAEVAKAEWHSEAYIGSAGVGAAIGGSVTALSVTAEGQIGNDTLGVHASGTATAGKISAELEGKLGIDKNGLTAKLGANAEAIAGEISGTAGVKVLGTDVAVKGSLNYGIGAHANVGIEGGKVTFDLGLTVGVGASVKLEVDVSGTVKAVAGAAKSAISYVQDHTEEIKDAVVNTVAGAGQAVADAGKAVVDGVANAGKAVADGIGNAASTLGKWLFGK